MGLHKAMHERVYSTPYEIDEKDKELLALRIRARQRLEGPSVGDFIITPKGYLRFTHHWGDSIQTTVKPGYDQSFYIGREGGMSFSGSLDHAIPIEKIVPTDEILDGSCWFFSHEYAEASNGIYVTVPCKVYRLLE